MQRTITVEDSGWVCDRYNYQRCGPSPNSRRFTGIFGAGWFLRHAARHYAALAICSRSGAPRVPSEDGSPDRGTPGDRQWSSAIAVGCALSDTPDRSRQHPASEGAMNGNPTLRLSGLEVCRVPDNAAIICLWRSRVFRTRTSAASGSSVITSRSSFGPRFLRCRRRGRPVLICLRAARLGVVPRPRSVPANYSAGARRSDDFSGESWNHSSPWLSPRDGSMSRSTALIPIGRAAASIEPPGILRPSSDRGAVVTPSPVAGVPLPSSDFLSSAMVCRQDASEGPGLQLVHVNARSYRSC